MGEEGNTSGHWFVCVVT